MHGDTAKGMDWPNEEQNQKRFKIMSELFLSKPASHKIKIKILDFGCGTSHFFEYLKEKEIANKILYTGIDINKAAIEISKQKFPINT